ncbi:F-box/kelch-repeat protein At3g23880-like [Camellia sinensis]|uniref:F-box/kelch-repeat protein At3g23880-like n=1 Tax=Camellia sinensis TaxID=4442 RepID=UPI001036D2F6|nr:F-box/kelch-repeat protein At3g23880-like [Camellia sinensis]
MQTLALRTILRKRKRRGGRRRRTRENEKTQIKATSELNLLNLPEEILIEILSRLPLKSLLQFNLVSKQWRSLIQSGFVKSVVPKHKVFVCAMFSSLYSIDEDCCVKSVPKPNQKNPSHGDVEISGSCNGLLLILIHDDLFLWNPLTRCSKKVLGYENLHDDGYHIASGLCFDSLSNDYKAVMALSHQTPSYGGEFAVVAHEIVYFNLRMNKFKKLPMPQPKNGGDILFGLGVLEGCLCMVCCCDEHRSYHVGIVEVLTMKEYGKQEFWITMFILSNLPSLNLYNELVPLCYAKNGEVLMKVAMDHIRTYNPIDNSQRKVRISNKCKYLDAIIYEESLVTPPDNNWEEEELRGEATHVETWLSGSWQKIKKVRGYWKYGKSSFVEEEYRESDSKELSM